MFQVARMRKDDATGGLEPTVVSLGAASVAGGAFARIGSRYVHVASAERGKWLRRF